MTSSNIHLLEQAERLLSEIDDELYSRAPAGLAKSGVGGHVRHCLDFYDNLFAGIAEGKVDYDCRERDSLIEQSRSMALAKVETIISRLRDVPKDYDRELIVKLEGDQSPVWNRSSVGRELQFLFSHTVHHYALIAMLLRIQGYEPSPDFGIAPSTLKHWQANA